jgi:hypothetical protein
MASPTAPAAGATFDAFFSGWPIRTLRGMSANERFGSSLRQRVKHHQTDGDLVGCQVTPDGDAQQQGRLYVPAENRSAAVGVVARAQS